MTRETGITLRSTDDALRLAQIAATSGLTSYRRPEAAAVILLTGHELGLGPMASLRGIYEVSGRPVLAADLMVAVVRASGHCESWRVVESTTTTCTITTRRKGEADAESCTWTMDDAKRAGCGGPTWQKFPRQMLSHRCAAELARRVYPDVLLGLYTPEEMGAQVHGDGTPAAVVVEAQPDEERAAIQSESAPHLERAAALITSARSLDALAASWRIVVREVWPHLSSPDREALVAAKDQRKAELAPAPSVPVGPPDAAQGEEWTATVDGQRAHVAALDSVHEARASALKHASSLGEDYVLMCAARVVALSGGEHTPESAERFVRTPRARKVSA